MSAFHSVPILGQAVRVAATAWVLCATMAAADLINGLGGPAGFGENAVDINDDESQFVNVTPAFPLGIKFAGVVYNGVYLNNNGNVTFGSALSTFTPSAITADTARPILAIWFADVDTRGLGMTPSPGGTSTGANRVWYDVDAVRGIVTFTWDDVGYYNRKTDKKNAFQMRLIRQNATDFNLQYRYEHLEWTTGDASGGSNGLGGTVVRAGWSCGNGTNYYELPQSGIQSQMLRLVNPGIIEWRVADPVPTLTAPGTVLVSGTRYTAATHQPISITFDQMVTGFTIDDLLLSGPGGPTLTNFGGSNATWSVTVVTAGDGPYSVDLPAGVVENPFLGTNLAGSVSFVVDRTAPMVDAGVAQVVSAPTTLVGTASDGASGLASVRWSQISGPANLSIASRNSLSTGVSAPRDGVYILALQATDAVGNRATDTTTLYCDLLPPLATISAPSAPAARAGASVTYTVTYTDSSSGVAGITLADGDVQVITTGDAAATALVSGSGSTRTVTLTGFTGNGTVAISLAAGTATDTVGRSALAAGPSTTITIDNIAPIVGMTATPSTTADSTPAIRGSCNESGSTVQLLDGATVIGTGVVVNGVWTVTPLAPLLAGTYNFNIRVTDPAGNSADVAVPAMTVDISGPTFVVTAGTVRDEVAFFTAVSTEPVSGLTGADVVAEGTAGGARTVAVSADATRTIFTIRVAGLAAPTGSVTVMIAADAAIADADAGLSLESNTATSTYQAPVVLSEGGSCGSGGIAGLLIAVLGLLGLRRRRDC
jgi:hypothetical protein